MRLLGNTSFIAPALVTALAITSQSVSAQSLHVPFKFEAAGRSLPAGDYEVSRDFWENTVTLSSRDHSRNFSFVLQPGNEGQHGVSLRFDQNGSGYELNSIAVDGKITSKLDTRTPSVREARGD